MTGRCAAALFAVAAAGCGAERDAFEWRIELGGLDRALLSTAVAGDEVIAVGGDRARGYLIEWDPIERSWREAALPANAGALWWAWADGAGAAFAVGTRATILRRTGATWVADDVSALVSPVVTFYGVWGAHAGDVWVVGGTLTPGPEPGVILHWDGAAWSRAAVVGDTLFKVWGAAADDVWAVGDDGIAVHRDAAGWSVATTPTADRLIAVTGRAGDDVYAVGGDTGGIVLRWDGAAWTTFASTPRPLAGVWTQPGAALFVGGADGYLERFAANGDRAAFTLDAGADVHALAGDAMRVIAVGADLVGTDAAGLSGVLATHGAPLAATIEPGPDAPVDAPTDASRDAAVDAAIADAGPPADAEPDAGPDAGPADAGLPGPGEPCDVGPAACMAGLICYLVDPPPVLVCTELCTNVTECAAYGPGACCRVPNPQMIETVCLPAPHCD